MTALRRVADGIAAYAAHPDPLAATANTVALLVVANQPFYPLYLYWLVSNTIWPSYFTFFSTVFFLAVPAVSRLSSRAGRALLPLTGIGNSVLCAKLFGTASGVEMFLIPSGILALILFRPSERWIGLAIAGLAFAVYEGLHGRYGAPLHLYTPAEYQAFANINVLSAAMLCGFVALVFANMLAAAEVKAEVPINEKDAGASAEAET